MVVADVTVNVVMLTAADVDALDASLRLRLEWLKTGLSHSLHWLPESIAM